MLASASPDSTSSSTTASLHSAAAIFRRQERVRLTKTNMDEASVNRAYEIADMYDAEDDTNIFVRNVVDLFSLYPLCVAKAWVHNTKRGTLFRLLALLGRWRFMQQLYISALTLTIIHTYIYIR